MLSNSVFVRLNILLEDMDLPMSRRNIKIMSNLRWLARNLGIRNSQHPNFAAANELIKILLRATDV